MNGTDSGRWRAATAPTVVVVGGSAGALDALGALLDALPPGFEVPLAVVIHLPVHRSSGLARALAGRGGRIIVEAEDKAPLESGHVYLAPPDYHLLVEHAAPPMLALSIDPPVNFSIPSIDVLFESAAHACGPRLAGVILSGANDDGAAGLAAVVAAGGRGFVQAPATAAMPAMPSAALARVPGALAAPVDALARALAGLVAPELCA